MLLFLFTVVVVVVLLHRRERLNRRRFFEKMMMMRLVSSFAILRVKIVVVRIRAVALRIRTLVPKRRDESPHALSRRLLSLFKVSFKNQQRAQTQRRRDKKEGEKTQILWGQRHTLRENKTTERDIKKKLEKKRCSHYNSAYFQHAVRWFETKERNEEEKEKKESSESERETKCEFLRYLLESFFTFEYIFYTLLLNDYLFTPPSEPSEKAPFWFVNKTRYHKIQKKIFRVYKIPTRPRRPPFFCARSGLIAHRGHFCAPREEQERAHEERSRRV